MMRHTQLLIFVQNMQENIVVFTCYWHIYMGLKPANCAHISAWPVSRLYWLSISVVHLHIKSVIYSMMRHKQLLIFVQKMQGNNVLLAYTTVYVLIRRICVCSEYYALY